MFSDIERLTSFDKDILLAWFLHYLPMGHDRNPDGSARPDETKATRYELMREFPSLYNRLCGREIVRVIRTEDGSPA
jgi:hypothetical protein